MELSWHCEYSANLLRLLTVQHLPLDPSSIKQGSVMSAVVHIISAFSTNTMIGVELIIVLKIVFMLPEIMYLY